MGYFDMSKGDNGPNLHMKLTYMTVITAVSQKRQKKDNNNSN